MYAPFLSTFGYLLFNPQHIAIFRQGLMIMDAGECRPLGYFSVLKMVVIWHNLSFVNKSMTNRYSFGDILATFHMYGP